MELCDSRQISCLTAYLVIGFCHGTRGVAIHVFFYKRLRNWATTETFLKLSDFHYSKFLTSFLKVRNNLQVYYLFTHGNFKTRLFDAFPFNFIRHADKFVLGSYGDVFIGTFQSSDKKQTDYEARDQKFSKTREIFYIYFYF